MKSRRVLIVFGVLAVLGLAISYWFRGRIGMAGFALGVVGTSFNVLALWWVTQLLGSLHGAEKVSRLGATISVLAFLVKLPMIIALFFFAAGLGEAARTTFLAGLGLVYFALVGWAVAQS